MKKFTLPFSLSMQFCGTLFYLQHKADLTISVASNSSHAFSLLWCCLLTILSTAAFLVIRFGSVQSFTCSSALPQGQLASAPHRKDSFPCTAAWLSSPANRPIRIFQLELFCVLHSHPNYSWNVMLNFSGGFVNEKKGVGGERDHILQWLNLKFLLGAEDKSCCNRFPLFYPPMLWQKAFVHMAHSPAWCWDRFLHMQQQFAWDHSLSSWPYSDMWFRGEKKQRYLGLIQNACIFCFKLTCSLQTMCLDFCTCTWKPHMCRYSLVDQNFTYANKSTHLVGCRKEVPSKVHVGESRKAENLLKETLSLQVPACSQPINTHWDLTSITIDTNGFTPSQDIDLWKEEAA